MLILKRGPGDAVRLFCDGVAVDVVVLDVVKGQARLGFTAPSAVKIWRSELLPAISAHSPPDDPDHVCETACSLCAANAVEGVSAEG